MKTMGFINSHKENEKRIAVLPKDLEGLSEISTVLFLEKGYGSNLGILDEDYRAVGAQIQSRNYILENCDIICDVKAGDAEYMQDLAEGKTIFGWVHPHVCEEMKQLLLEKRFSVYAWEEMIDNGMQVFYRNNELAGEASVMHAAQCCGILLEGKKVAVIGRGNTAQGAIRALNRGGANVTVYGRKQETKFRNDLGMYDIIVNAVLWDPKRNEHIIDRACLKRMRRGTLLVDVSCDEHGAVETCLPTHFNDPIYTVDGVIHYCVDHSPSIYFRSASEYISCQVKRFIRPLVMDESDEVLESGHIIENGRMILAESCR